MHSISFSVCKRRLMVASTLCFGGQGLRVVAERLGCAMQQAVFFGDGGNDIEALRACGLGVAVANATDKAKIAADYTSRYRNTENAVARELVELAEEFGTDIQLNLDLPPAQTGADQLVKERRILSKL